MAQTGRMPEYEEGKKKKLAPQLIRLHTAHMLNLDIYSTSWSDHMLHQAAPMSVNVAFLIFGS